jgi:hypothetical protein
MIDAGRIVVRLAAATAIALGFALLGLLAYKHIYIEGGGTVGMVWIVLAGCLILWGAGVLDFSGASQTLHDLVGQAGVVAPLLRGVLGVVLPGGNRAGDPKAVPATAEIAEAQSQLPQSGTLAGPHAYDPGA